ncbi:MAG: AgmX/PglI C-terminal domain-containing protein, partial [Myxococcota bacterium]
YAHAREQARQGAAQPGAGADDGVAGAAAPTPDSESPQPAPGSGAAQPSGGPAPEGAEPDRVNRAEPPASKSRSRAAKTRSSPPPGSSSSRSARALRASSARAGSRDGAGVGSNSGKRTGSAAIASDNGPSDGDIKRLRQQIAQVVQRKQSELQDCYNQATRTASDHSVHGRLDIQITINATGRAGDVRSVKNNTGSEQLARCVVGCFSRWKYPEPPGAEPLELVWPLRFRAPK